MQENSISLEGEKKKKLAQMAEGKISIKTSETAE